MGIELRHGSSNYAKTNGKVERYQGVVMKLVLKGLTASNDPSVKWHLHLPKAVWSWRIQPKGEMGVSPYLMVYGQEPRWVNKVAGAEVEDLSYTLEELQDIWETDGSVFKKAVRNDVRKRIMDRQKAISELPSPNVFVPGELVYLWDKRKDDRHDGKFLATWKGPYYVKKQHSNGSYELEDSQGRKIGKGYTYNHSHLKRVNLHDHRRILEFEVPITDSIEEVSDLFLKTN